MVVYITDKFDASARARLLANSQILLTEDLSQAEAALIRSRTEVDALFLARTPKLKYVVTSTSGFNHIHLQLCEQRGIRAFYTPDANAQSTAELTWLLILAAARCWLQAQKCIATADWDRKLVTGTQLEGRTIGIYGLGRVGCRVARIAGGFGINVIAHDPYASDENFRSTSAMRASWDEMIPQADILSVHVPLTQETRTKLNPKTLERLPDQCILVNAARGELLPEQTALLLLKAHPGLILALDVMDQEPLSLKSELLAHPRVLLSPHMGAATTQAYAAGAMAAVQTVEALLAGQEPPNALPPKAEWARFIVTD